MDVKVGNQTATVRGSCQHEADHANGPISAGGRGIDSTLIKRSGTPLIPAMISGEEHRNPLDNAEGNILRKSIQSVILYE